MKHRKLEIKLPTEDYCWLVQEAEDELRTPENEAAYLIRKNVNKPKETKGDDDENKTRIGVLES